MGNSSLSAIDVFKQTARSNCRECGLPNCMAFSALVVAGQKEPADCPYLKPEFIERISTSGKARQTRVMDETEQMIGKFRDQIREIDFAQAADRLGGRLNGEWLSMHCLGRIFEIDKQGGLHSECHVNNWIHLPLLNYIIRGQGKEPQREWVTFKELKEAQDWANFFVHRCEGALHKMADEHTDLFLDILDLFGDEPVSKDTTADHSVVLWPLPKVPFQICYWPKDGKFESKLTVFFDKSVTVNLDGGAIYSLAQGIAEMFGRIVAKHDHPALQGKIRGRA